MSQEVDLKVKEQFIGSNYVLGTSAKSLYLGLELDLSNWKRWSDKNIVNNEFFTQDVDFIELVTMTSSPNPTKDYVITVDFAKHLAMMARTEKAHLYRNYFIKCETDLKKLKAEQAEFHKFRESARHDAIEFSNAVFHYSQRNLCSYQDYHGAREFDLLNVIALGMKASEYKQRNNLPESLKSIRDNLTTLEIEAIEYLQRMDTALLEMDRFNFNERHDELKRLFDKKFADRFALAGNKHLLEQHA
jgi:phage anti-repressor protein